MNWIWIQLISLLLSLFFLIASIRLIIKMDFFSDKREYGWQAIRSDAIARTRVQKAWKIILKKIVLPDSGAWKEAIILADNEFDEIVRSSGYHGETPQERLMVIDEAAIANISRIRVLRADMAPDLANEEAAVDYGKAKELLREYRRAFQQLGMMK
ncbi:MAG: hypothetical protein WC246_01405 [Candidatus Paceibacterota bacterium]|jgi:hypothetical protein